MVFIDQILRGRKYNDCFLRVAWQRQSSFDDFFRNVDIFNLVKVDRDDASTYLGSIL